MSIWDYEKPLDAMMLSHDHMPYNYRIAALVLQHEQQIKDIAAHLLELKQSMPGMSLTTEVRREWVGLTEDEAAGCWSTAAVQTWKNFEAKLKEKNGG